MESYRLTAQRRKQRDLLRQRERWVRSQVVARQAADFLKQDYGVEEVILFGSGVTGEGFTLTSDLDLAVRGLAVGDFFTVVAQLQDLGGEFQVDLVQLERCSESLRQVILAEGKRL